MKLSTHTRRLLASAFVGALAMTPVYALAQDEPDQPAPRARARQEAQERRAREEERALRDAERAARDAEQGARNAEQGAREAERAARGMAERELARRQEGEGLFRIRPAVAETKPQTYLGVSTSPMTPERAQQAGDDVPPGVGLVISFVDEEGPAAEAGFEQDDVLIRMEDQWLINPSQLTVLIRMHKEGDEATFTVLRGGREREIEVTLGEKELPVMRMGGQFELAPLIVPGQPVAPVAPVPAIRGVPLPEGAWMRELDEERVEEINRRVQEAMQQLEQQLQGQDLGNLEERMEALRERLAQREMELQRLPRDAARPLIERGLRSGGRLFMNNDDVSLRMVNEDGEVTIVVEDADGETIYEGPYPDEDALSELPEEAQEIIKQARKYLPNEGDTPRPAPPAPRGRRPAAQDGEREPRAPRRESIPV